jgi:hypothetical protein
MTDLHSIGATTGIQRAVEPPVPVAATSPWPEPWGRAPFDRSGTEYWDLATATWRSRGPVPSSVRGD